MKGRFFPSNCSVNQSLGERNIGVSCTCKVTDRDFADELNVYVDWYGLDYLSLGALYAVTFPGDAATEAFGGDETFQIIQLYANVKF